MAKKQNLLERPIVKKILMMACISAALLIVIFLILKLYGRVGREFELPDLVGQNIEAVEDDNPLKLRYVVLDSIYEKGDAGGRILSQDPKPNSMVKKGRKIYVTITSYTPEDAQMPDLTDMTVRQAISQLANVGFSVGKLRFVDSPYRNAVLEQTCKGRVVKPGTKLDRGSVIDLTVGTGTGSGTGVVPFVLGKSPEAARRAVLSASFNIGAEHFNGIQDRSKAVVVRQVPDYTGVSQYNYGYSVELWYQDGTQIDVDKMVEEFRVDSSKIIYLERKSSDNVVYEDDMTDDSWIW